MDAIAPPPATFEAWNELWVGALSVHNRRLGLVASRDGEGIVWRIAARGIER